MYELVAVGKAKYSYLWMSLGYQMPAECLCHDVSEATRDKAGSRLSRAQTNQYLV